MKLLHVGSGGAGRESVMLEDFRAEEWEHVRVDIDPSVSPDVVDDIRTLAQFENHSCDGIYSSHNLEHLHSFEVPLALAAFNRVLRPGGLLFCVVPDFQMACAMIGENKPLETIYESPAGPITAMDMVFGYRPFTLHNQYQMHRCGFTVDLMRRFYTEAGFTKIRVQKGQGYDIWGLAEKHKSV